MAPSRATKATIAGTCQHVLNAFCCAEMPFWACFDKVINTACFAPAAQPIVSESGEDNESKILELEQRLKGVARSKSQDIDRYLHKCKRQEISLMKILLLGGPACGKSTIFKQMRILHQDGFKHPDEREYYAKLIARNVRDICIQLIEGAHQLRISIESQQYLISALQTYFAEHFSDYETTPRLSTKMAALVKRLWLSEPIQTVFAQRHQIVLPDHTEYFMKNVRRVGEPDYQPTNEDILHSREVTTTVTTTSFAYNGITLKLVDVGGQKSQRRKWLHLFDDVRVVLFIVDLTLYVRQFDDDTEVHSMHQTLILFKEVATNRILKRSLFLLFLNKADLYENLLKTVSFRSCFREYSGSESVSETLEFIKKEFLRAALPRRSVLTHVTTATDTQQVNMVFQACMETVLQRNARATGLQ